MMNFLMLLANKGRILETQILVGARVYFTKKSTLEVKHYGQNQN